MTTRTRKRRSSRRPLTRWLLPAAFAAVLVGAAAYWKIEYAPGGGPAQPEYTSVAAVYTVVPGDSLSAIASRYGVPVGDLIAFNGISNPDLLLAGTRLRIPGTTAGSSVTYDPQGAREIISSYAQQYRVSPAFALAIAWQESGFNQHMVSRTGAIGVMQVEPDTGTTIGNLLGRPVDLHDIHDNILAGVFLLSRLEAQYGGNERLVAAAYYQGAASVARDGLYADTRVYVDDVMALKGRFGG
jgi:N-acetylmuramoyl-L-alanine amidase